MSIRDWLRGLFPSSPARIEDGGDPEVDADLQEEFGAPDEGREDIEHLADTAGGGGGFVPEQRLAAGESAEAAEEDLESEEAPPDPDP